MARSRLCRCCNDFHDLDKPWPHNCASHFGVRPDQAFYVISDTMDGVLNHADGRMYDSKSRYTRAVKAAGCEIIGNDKVERRITPPRPVRDDIRRAIEQLSSR